MLEELSKNTNILYEDSPIPLLSEDMGWYNFPTVRRANSIPTIKPPECLTEVFTAQDLNSNFFLGQAHVLISAYSETDQGRRKSLNELGQFDTPLQHSYRIINDLRRFSPELYTDELAAFALLHDFADSRHIRNMAEAGFDFADESGEYNLNGLINTFFEHNDETDIAPLVQSLVSFDELECIGENIRNLVSGDQQRFNLIDPLVVSPEEVLEFVSTYGIETPIIKSLEVLDNLRNPLPGSMDPNDPNHDVKFAKMQQDALEAMYLYIPLMELMDQQEIVGELKNYATRFLSKEYFDLFNFVCKNLYSDQEFTAIQDHSIYEQEIAKLIAELQGQNYTFIPFKQFQWYISEHLQESDTYEEFEDSIKRQAATMSESQKRYFTIMDIREKYIGSGFLKAIKYYHSIHPEHDSIDPNILLDLVRHLPDIYATKVISGSQEITDLIANYYRGQPNVYQHPKPNAELIEQKNEERGLGGNSARYKGVHVVHQSVEMQRPLEVHAHEILDWIVAQYGPASHFIYKFKNGNSGDPRNVQKLVYDLLNMSYANILMH